MVVAGKEVNASMRLESRKKLWLAELGEVGEEQGGEYICEVSSPEIKGHLDPGDQPFWGKEHGEGGVGGWQLHLPLRFAPQVGGGAGLPSHHAQRQLRGVCQLHHANLEL